jgi:thiol-disulfide isomerase/thioredoxin
MAERILIWIFDHAAIVLPVVVLLLAALVYRIGRPRRWWHWLLQPALLLSMIIIGFLGLSFLRVTRALDGRTERIAFTPLAGGEAKRVRDYRGQVVVLNYWATWCPPCRAEIPDINRLADTYRSQGVVVLELSDEEPELLQRFLAKYPMHGVVARFTSPEPASNLEAFAWRGRPTTLVLDRQGRIVRRIIGGRHYADFEAAVKAAL